MIVDDNRQNREVSSAFLENKHAVLAVDSGEACLEALSKFHPDVILLDWMMPGLDGLATLKIIRETITLRNIRIIMLTAKVQPDDITTAWRAGADDYILKPFEMNELIEAVQRQLAEKHTQDLSDKKWQEMEDSVRQAQKMEALGALAGGIAHDFNNILFPIQAYSEILEEHSDPDVLNCAGEIKTAARRAANLVRQILAFSRQSQQEVHPVEISLIIKEALKLIQASFPASIRIRSQIKPECTVVLADPTSIHQIVMNLCTNARHAMDETGGTMSVRLEKYQEKQPIEGLKANAPYLELAVTDTGCGIAPEIREKIFHPYFTTKPVGKGTGLGLSVVHGILKELGGTIVVESEVGTGTTVRIYLPVLTLECVESKKTPTKIIGGKETILVVDDEPAIAEMFARMLGSMGYHVKSFTKINDVLQALLGGGDLLITDMTMPEMTGMELAEKAWKLKKDLPVILMTGFSEAIDRQSALEKGIKELLFKPVGKADLSVAIRQALKKNNS